MKKIAVILGSNSDLKYCRAGLSFLSDIEAEEQISVTVFTRSHLRNTMSLLNLIKELSVSIDVIIAGAGWASHPASFIDAFLRNDLGNAKLPVIGVAFEDKDNPRHSVAAQLSITEVPGTQVIMADDERNPFIGEYGFFLACQRAVFLDFKQLTLPERKVPKNFSLKEALEIASVV